MAFTRPKAAQIDFDLTNITDTLIRINSSETGANANDMGIVFERGSHTNAAIVWDESADAFRLISTTHDASTTTSDINISAHHNLHVGALETTGNVTVGGNLTVTGTTTTVDVASINITNSFSFEGATPDGFETTLTVADPTADRTITLPDVTGYAAILQSEPGTTLITATVAELNYVDGVTSNIQTQIDNISSSFTLAADSGTNDTFTTGQTLTIAGGTGIDTTVSDNNISIAIDSTVATLTGTQTLTNKTITSPTISNPTLTGTYTFTSDATSTPAMTLTANSINDGVGALRINGSQADIFLNPSTATHTTITFAVNDDQRLAFGMDNNSDFYITRRTSSTWYDDTFVLDRDTGLLSLGYGATVAGTLTYSTLNDGTTALTSTVAELNLLDGVSAGTATASKAVIYDSNGGIVASGDINLNDADDQIVHGDTDYNQKQYVLYGTTTDATETEIFVGGTASSRIPVATDTTVFYEVDIVARRTDATGESGGWHLKAVADNFSGTVADVGSVYEVQVASDDANFSVDCRADNTNDSVGVYVTGAAGKTIRWTAIVRTFEVAQ